MTFRHDIGKREEVGVEDLRSLIITLIVLVPFHRVLPPSDQAVRSFCTSSQPVDTRIIKYLILMVTLRNKGGNGKTDRQLAELASGLGFLTAPPSPN